MQAGTTTIFKVFGMTGPPYRHLFRSAGAAEDLFVTRELQEPPPENPYTPYEGLISTNQNDWKLEGSHSTQG